MRQVHWTVETIRMRDAKVSEGKEPQESIGAWLEGSGMENWAHGGWVVPEQGSQSVSCR